jgi:PAS domain S-box-containing protein
LAALLQPNGPALNKGENQIEHEDDDEHETIRARFASIWRDTDKPFAVTNGRLPSAAFCFSGSFIFVSLPAMKAFPRDAVKRLDRVSPRVAVVIGLAYVLALGTIDYKTPGTISFSLLYLFGIAFVGWIAGARLAILAAVIAAGVKAADDWQTASRTAEFPLDFILNTLMRLGIFVTAGWLVAYLARLTRQLSSTIDERAGQYRTILATAMDGFTLIDESGHIVDANDAYCRMVGHRKEELLGTSLLQLEAKESPEEIARHMARIHANGSDRFETRHRHKEGPPVDVEISVSCMPDNKDMVVFAREIGERKRAEARLRESEERYRGLAESSPDVILIVDRHFKIQYANSAAASLWKRTPETLVGMTQDLLFEPETVRRHAELGGKIFETGSPLRFDERISFPNGERWIETRLVPIPGPDGKVHSMIVIAVDISERKRIQSLLEAQRDLGAKLSSTNDLTTALEALLDVAIDLEGVDCGGVYLSDPGTGDLNMAAHKGPLSTEFIEGVSHFPASSERAHLIRKGRPVYDLYEHVPITHDQPRHREQLRAVALLPMCHEGQVVGSLHLGSHSQDSIPTQSRIVMEAIAAQAAGAIARIRSETERRRLERQILEITDREQARIGQELHDGLCQHLVSLAFDANSLNSSLAGKPGPEASVASRIAHYLDEAITEARQLSRGLFPIRLEAVGLVPALEELAASTRTRFGVDCSAKSEGPVKVNNAATAIHLYRIAQEAVTNAIKHGRPKRVAIRLCADANQLQLEIADDGPGLSAEAAPGTSGMGLHIMDYRARSVGGTLRIARGGRGGTTVRCCVPSPTPEIFES